MKKDWRTLSELERLLYRELFRKDCYSFCCEFWEEVDSHPFIEGNLTRFFCETYQYMSRYWVEYTPKKFDLPKIGVDEVLVDVREDKHYMSISVPPRHGKSNFFNILCPVWLFINDPIKVASVSHTQNLAGTMNIKRQKLLNSDKFKFFFPEIYLLTNSTYSLKDDRNGEMYSIPKNAITGFGADMLIVDDLTNVSQAKRDAAEMEHAWSIYTETLPSRINDVYKFAFINIMQRIAPNDIVGRILADPKLAENYIFVNLPAQFDKTTYLVCPISGKIFKYNKGDYLFPEAFGDYSTIRANMPNSTWQSQYLQQPQNSDMTIIKENMIIEKDLPDTPGIENADMIYSSTDFPVKDKETSDFLGSVLAYRKGSTLYITDCLEKRLAFVKGVNYIKQLDAYFPGIIQIIEDKANGSGTIQILQEELAGIQAFNPGDKSKVMRLENASLYINNVVFVKTIYNKENKSFELTPGLRNLKERLLEFPFVQHDDIVDAFSMLLLFVFLDKKYSVYGRSFTDENVVKIDRNTFNVPTTVFFNKEGDNWKVCEIGIKYSVNSKLIVLSENQFKASVEDGLQKLHELYPNKKVFIDCSATNSLIGIFKKSVIVERYEEDDFDRSVARLSLLLSNKQFLLDYNCASCKADIELFKYSKSKDENNIKYVTEKDGFVACMRIALKYYGMK